MYKYVRTLKAGEGEGDSIRGLLFDASLLFFLVFPAKSRLSDVFFKKTNRD